MWKSRTDWPMVDIELIIRLLARNPILWIVVIYNLEGRTEAHYYCYCPLLFSRSYILWGENECKPDRLSLVDTSEVLGSCSEYCLWDKSIKAVCTFLATKWVGTVIDVHFSQLNSHKLKAACICNLVGQPTANEKSWQVSDTLSSLFYIYGRKLHAINHKLMETIVVQRRKYAIRLHMFMPQHYNQEYDTLL